MGESAAEYRLKPPLCTYCREQTAHVNKDGSLASPPFCFNCLVFRKAEWAASIKDARQAAEQVVRQKRLGQAVEAEYRRVLQKASEPWVWETYDALPAEARVYYNPADGRYYRNVPRPLGGADLYGERVAVYELVPRPVALSLAEAREKSWDFYNPVRGWIRDGLKAERERPEIEAQIPLSNDPPQKSMEVREFVRQGGEWPPPRTTRDDFWDLADRRDELEREIRLAEPRRMMAQAFGDSTDQVDSDERRHRAELKRLQRAMAALQTSNRGPAPRTSTLSDAEFIAELERAGAPFKNKPQITERQVVLRMPLGRTAFRSYLERIGVTWPEVRERLRRGQPIK